VGGDDALKECGPGTSVGECFHTDRWQPLKRTRGGVGRRKSRTKRDVRRDARRDETLDAAHGNMAFVKCKFWMRPLPGHVPPRPHHQCRRLPRRPKGTLHSSLPLLPTPQQTQASPLAQRVQFLEAKGLTTAEIDTALRQASHSSYQPSYGAPFASAHPQTWDWRDYFVSSTSHSRTNTCSHSRTQITAVVSGSVAYGAVALFKVGPSFLLFTHCSCGVS